jgi:hypothetical protein
MRISARIYQDFNDICTTEYYGEDEGSLTTAGSFVYVRTPGNEGGYNFFIAGSYGAGQWA